MFRLKKNVHPEGGGPNLLLEVHQCIISYIDLILFGDEQVEESRVRGRAGPDPLQEAHSWILGWI